MATSARTKASLSVTMFFVGTEKKHCTCEKLFAFRLFIFLIPPNGLRERYYHNTHLYKKIKRKKSSAFRVFCHLYY